MTVEFYPHFYDVKDMAHAKRAVVGDVDFEDGEILRHEDRWESDTAYTLDFIEQHLPLGTKSSVLDYGCGMGRIAKGLVERFRCGEVVGIDSNESMRWLAEEYVDSDRFTVASEVSGQFDYAICLWVLQHCRDPRVDIESIKRSLKPGGKLLVFNDATRNVPTSTGFAIDDVNVTDELAKVFGHATEAGQLDPARVHPKLCARSFWAIYTKRTKLNLGCAYARMPDAENVDINPVYKPDRVVDLERFPWPWADASVDEICMHHSLEHLGADPNVFLRIMRELYRVLVPGGKVRIQVPHPRHDNYINSPTHVRPITSITLQQFSQEWNRKTRGEGYANETFGELLGVDFKITENELIIAKPWWEKYQRGLVSKEELEFAVASYWNVIEECRITIEKVPLA